jgi:hypothetical protein
MLSKDSLPVGQIKDSGEDIPSDFPARWGWPASEICCRRPQAGSSMGDEAEKLCFSRVV